MKDLRNVDVSQEEWDASIEEMLNEAETMLNEQERRFANWETNWP